MASSSTTTAFDGLQTKIPTTTKHCLLHHSNSNPLNFYQQQLQKTTIFDQEEYLRLHADLQFLQQKQQQKPLINNKLTINNGGLMPWHLLGQQQSNSFIDSTTNQQVN